MNGSTNEQFASRRLIAGLKIKSKSASSGIFIPVPTCHPRFKTPLSSLSELKRIKAD